MNHELKQNLKQHKEDHRHKSPTIYIENLLMKFEINDLIAHTILYSGQQPDIYIDFTLYKYYSILPEINQKLLSHLNRISIDCVNRFGGLIFHINADRLLLSSVQKYILPLLKTQQEMQENNEFQNVAHKIQRCFIYNSSSIFSSVFPIIKPFLSPFIAKSMIIIPTNEQSEKYIQEITRQLPISNNYL